MNRGIVLMWCTEQDFAKHVRPFAMNHQEGLKIYAIRADLTGSSGLPAIEPLDAGLSGIKDSILHTLYKETEGAE